MDQYLDNRHKQILYDLLANPADTGQLYITSLQRMANDYPQSGLLQVLAVRAGEKDDIKKAAVYFKPNTLYKLVHSPDTLPAVSADRIAWDETASPENYFSIAATDEDRYTPPADAVRFNSPELAQHQNDVAPSNGPEATINHASETFITHETVEVPVEEEVTHKPITDTEQPETIEPAVDENELPVEIDKAKEERVTDSHFETAPETALTPPDPVAGTEINDEVHEEIQDTDHIIPELYNSYTEQLAHPHLDDAPADEQMPEPDSVISGLYDSYEEQLAGQEEKHPEPEAEAPATFTNLSEDNGYRAEKESFRQDIEDEVYDEIVGIDQIGFEPTVNVLHESETQVADIADEQHSWQNTFADGEDYPEDEEEQDERPLQRSAGITDADIAIDEERLIMGNIVSADYLTFDKKLDELRSGKVEPQPAIADVSPTDAEPIPKEQDVVSRYNDDSMPYSFMWWLDKTRKEHAETFQPYTANPVQPAANSSSDEQRAEQPHVKPVTRKAPDELQQQYYENIFSLTSVSGIERDDTDKGLEFDQNKKEDIIIERFINTEPQIRPPAANRLDNENKAKKSSEDQDALVTETLARIYNDQMLYHKAIATYKKLILKFPEKKLYFAAQIEQLEKKTN
ncbi:hypothetical protein [Mucilaginibacter glaciei]|uniref:Tetratricopeptide repeat protein n=1 Tax=Mucilaginibacter glaciei TaxID=2772109 RepID=A0A926NQA7_9SPHI|nr:hypothetical protein [Mucilaginibacter glaciei]MBD1393991.1 hypothetical protein [Mucilaginibacter glaciei]